MNDCLVYFFTGFLDSGKTSLICTWLNSEEFTDSSIVVLQTEEGEIEYKQENYPNGHPIVINIETDEITSEFMFKLEKEHKPDIILMEWNGSVSPKEFFDNIDVPRRFLLANSIVTVDASTYSEYFRNMQPLFAEYYKFSDTVLFNRVDPEVDNLPKLRATVKSINPSVNIAFFGEGNEPVLIEDHLPYNLDDDPCEISNDDFGLFYTDVIDNVKRYNGKTVSLIGKATVFPEIKNKGFALTRPAYTCCADDVGEIQLLCLYNFSSDFPANKWIKITGQIRYFEQKQGDNIIPMPCITVKKYSLADKPEIEMVYFS